MLIKAHDISMNPDRLTEISDLTTHTKWSAVETGEDIKRGCFEGLVV